MRDQLRLALDPAAFAHSLGIEPDPWQADLLRSGSKRVLLNVSRQGGKSSMAAVLALHRALFHPGSLVLVLAPALRQSQELFGKVATYYRGLGRPVPASGERRLSLELENGSRIVTLPGTEKTVRGFSGTSLLLVDEAARVDDALYYAVRPMLAVSGGSLMMMSTPYGRRGVFFEEWTTGIGWERYEVPATKCPRISPEFLAEERAALPARVYQQEYCNSFAEVEDQVFRDDLIEAAFTNDAWPLWEDFSLDGVAEYLLNAEGRWVRAEDLVLGRRPRTLEEIGKDVRRALAGAHGFDPDRIIKEYRDAEREGEVQSGR